MIDNALYPGSFFRLLERLDEKEVPFRNVERVLPRADCDLIELFGAPVPEADEPQDHPIDTQDPIGKMSRLRKELSGTSELHVLHAMVIAVLRRRDPPEVARDLFFRIWREQGDTFAKALSVRWLISAATTFADHGETPAQRSGGMGLSILFDLIKLHDSERRISGKPGHLAFARDNDAGSRVSLAFDMEPYALRRGDLDMNMLARLWRLCEADAVLRPLGMTMLRMVMSDKRSIFARLRSYRD